MSPAAFLLAAVASTTGCNFGNSTSPGDGGPGAGNDAVLSASVGTGTSASQDFGDVPVGHHSASVSIVVSNTGPGTSGAVTVSLSGADSASFGIDTNACTATLSPGQTCTVAVHFSPASAGTRSTSLTFGANPGGLASVALTGKGVGPGTTAAFSMTPAAYDFGALSVGATSGTQTFTIENTGGVASTAPAVAVTGANAADFAVLPSTCGNALAAGAKCTVGVMFKPATSGAETATLGVTASGAASASATLQGTGLAPAPIAFNPMSQAFGTEVPGQASADVSFKLTNGATIATGPVAVTLGGTDGNQFVLTPGTCAGAGGTGAVLAPGASCTVSVHFKPDGTVAAGPAQATLQATATPGGTTAATLTGIVAAPARVTISPTSQVFGAVVQQQASSDFPFVVTNGGGVTTGPLTVALGGTNAADFAKGTDACNQTTLAAGASCTVNVHFAPGASVTGPAQASLSVGDSAANTATATLTGTAAAPASLAITAPAGFPGFGPAMSPTVTADVTFTVTNGGGVASGPLTVALGGANAGDFGKGADTCTGASLPASGASTCVVNVHFAPTAGTVGNEQGTVTVSGTPGGSAPISFVGIAAIPSLVISPPSGGFTGFGTVAVGQSAAATFSVKNTGPVASTAAPAIVGSGGDYAVTASTTNPCATALAPGASCDFVVTFTPSAVNATDSTTLTASVSPGNAGTYALTSAGAEATLAISPPAAWSGFGTVEVNTSATATFTVTNTGPVSTNGVPAVTSSNGDFVVSAGPQPCTAALPANGTCDFVVTFTPQMTVTNDSSTLTASSPQAVSGTYVASGSGAVPTLAILPLAFTGFGYVTVGQSASATLAVQNSGPVGSGMPTVSSSNPDFTISAGVTNPCSGALAVNATCNFTLTFGPTSSASPESSVLTASASPANAGTYTATGQGGVGLLQGLSAWNAPPTDQASGTQTTYNIVNTGHGRTNPLQVSLPAGPFNLQTDTCTGAALDPTAQCTLSVNFAPTANNSTPATTASATLTVTDSGTDGQTAALSGLVLSPTPYVVISPAPVDFGSGLTPGSSTTMPVTATNYSSQQAVVSSLRLLNVNGYRVGQTGGCVNVTLAGYGQATGYTCSDGISLTAAGPTTSLPSTAAIQALNGAGAALGPADTIQASW